MVSMPIGFTMVFSRVGQDNLARVVISVNGEKGLLLVVAVGHNSGAEGVVVKFSRGFISKVNMGVAHKFKFCQAQCLFGDGAMDDILFHRREAVRVEGDKFHCQISCAPEDCGLQCFVEEDYDSTLVLLGYLNMDSPHGLVLG